MSEKKFDLILFGATSFVGQIMTEYLSDQYQNDKSLKWAIAGRSSAKLNELRRKLDLPLSVEQFITNANDENSLKILCDKTDVIVSTVGPYALYGEPLLKVCAETGTHYCDLTGEAQWIKLMIDKYEQTAKKSGARIVHCCGFDSIPSDLGVFFLQKQAKKEFGTYCNEVNMRVKAIKGGMSGGTVASLLNVVEEAASNPALRKELQNPYSVCGTDHGFTARQKNTNKSAYDAHFDAWVAPFIMAAINTRIVHRSNLLLNKAYGENFLYDEAVLTGKGIKGTFSSYTYTGAIGGFMLAAAIKPTRWLLKKFVVPKPGEGPSKTAQDHGFYDLRFFGLTEHNEVVQAKVTGDKDPGYGSTAKMLGEAAICLAKDVAKSKKGGFWTPSTLMGDKLIKRLTQNAGLTFEIIKP